MKHNCNRVRSLTDKGSLGSPGLTNRLLLSLMAFTSLAAALLSGATNRLELTILLAFLSYVVITTAHALTACRRRKLASIEAHLDRLAACFDDKNESLRGPWGVRAPIRDAAVPCGALPQ